MRFWRGIHFSDRGSIRNREGTEEKPVNKRLSETKKQPTGRKRRRVRRPGWSVARLEGEKRPGPSGKRVENIIRYRERSGADRRSAIYRHARVLVNEARYVHFDVAGGSIRSPGYRQAFAT